MSFQLIYTSAPTLLDPGLSGYGVVARSKDMPRLLSKKLAKLSVFKDELKLVSGPQFSYNILDCAGATFHVLTCVQSAGVDYSGRECHIAHHLVLTKQEVRDFKENKARPTPAGLMLGLYRGEFWATCWKVAPEEIQQEAELSTDMLPELHQQSMWKELTGHKYNAKTLITPPYEHDCLIIVQPGTRSLDILHLLAESDWLSASRGWGITFTTTGYSQDTFAQTQRIAVIEESVMASKARRSGRPILKLVHKLLIPRQEQLDTPSSPQMAHNISSSHSRDWTQLESPPTPSPRKKAPLVSQPQGHQLAEIPYKYQESSDEQSYMPPEQKKCPSRVRWIASLLLIVPLLISATVYFMYDRDDLVTDTPSEHSGRGQEPLPPLYAPLYTQNIQDIENIHQQLLELARQSYHAPKAQKKLHDLQTQIASVLSQASPRMGEDLHHLQAIITKLHEAQEQNISYTYLLESLINYAHTKELEIEPLARLLLRQCTQRHKPSEWIRSMSEKDAQRILHILHEHKLHTLFNEPKLYSYLHALDRHAPVKRQDINKASSFKEILSKYAHLNRRELIIINKNDALPPILQEILQDTPISIDQGSLTVSPLIADEWTSNLQKDKHGIRIIPTSAEGLKQIQLISKNKPSPPAALLLQADTIFHQFSYQGRAALLSLKLSASPAANQYIFVPDYRQTLVPLSRSYELPELMLHDFEIAEDELESIPPDSLQPFAQLRLTSEYRSQFPWKTIQSNLELKESSSIKLPSYLGYSNEINIESPPAHLRHVEPLIRHTLHINKYSSQPYIDERYQIKLKRNYDFNTFLMREFYTLANSNVVQEKITDTGYHSIASLYHLLTSMEEISDTSEFDHLMTRYFKLYQNRPFATHINKIFSARADLQLKPIYASHSSPLAEAERAKLSEAIRDTDTRAFMRECLRTYLSEKLYLAYRQIRHRAKLREHINQRHELELYHLEKQKNKLIWHFRLINTLTAWQPTPTP